MPSRRRVSAPANRVYKSSTPLQQTKLPDAKRRVRSYGKQTRPKLKMDNTLTQMDFVKLFEQGQDPEEEEEDDDLGMYEEQAMKRKSKRRRTMGDTPSRTPQFHTQTLTQLERSFSSTGGEQEEVEQEEDNDAIFDGPSSSQVLPLPKKGRKRRKIVETISEEVDKIPSSMEMPPPQTPRKISALEIPSSQSPATPISIHTRGSSRRSPLKDKPINVPIPFDPRRRAAESPTKAPKLVIRDTFDTETTGVSQMSRIPSSPPKKLTSTKRVRFQTDEDMAEKGNESDEGEEEEPQSPSVRRQGTPFRGTQQMARYEIVDSDADSDESDQEYDTRTPTQNVGNNSGVEDVNQDKSLDNQEVDVEDESELSSLSSNGEDEESIILGRHSQETRRDQDSQEFSQVARADMAPMPTTEEDQESIILGESNDVEQEPETCYGEIGVETQFKAERLLETSSSLVSQLDSQLEEQLASETMQEKTQLLESQRLETQYVAAMAPRTTDSDVFVSMHPQQVQHILDRTKNHDMRNWQLPPSVHRIWICELAPVSMLTYMAEIGPAKRPGEIEDEHGLGNKEFNKKGATWRAYEILQVYTLADPYPITKLIRKEWIREAPKRRAFVRPAAQDELIANLMPPLFVDDHSVQTPPSSSTDTQDAEAQLLSTIQQFTQAALPAHPPSSPKIKSEPQTQHQTPPPSTPKIKPEPLTQQQDPITSSPHLPPHIHTQLPPPSQAETVDLTQAPTQTPFLYNHNHHPHPSSEIIFESPTRPVPSSTPIRLPSPRSDGGLFLYGGQVTDSLVPYSMNSSQLLTRSQLVSISESLLNESVPGPPPIVEDSDEEGEDEL